MAYAFKVGDRVIVAPGAFTREGESCIITLIDGDFATVAFDDGGKTAYLLDDGELLLQESIDPHIIFFNAQWEAFKARWRAQQALARANTYRYAALMAPTDRQAPLANWLADRAMDELMGRTETDG